MGMSPEEIVFLFTVSGLRRPRSRSVSASLHLCGGGGARRSGFSRHLKGAVSAVMHLLDLYLCLFPRVGAHHLYPAGTFVFSCGGGLCRRVRPPVPELAASAAARRSPPGTFEHVWHVQAGVYICT